MEKKYLNLEDISAYTIAFELSNYVWDIVIKWKYFNSNQYRRIECPGLAGTQQPLILPSELK